MYIKVLEYLCKTVLTIYFQEAATQMYSVKKMFWKFQEKFFTVTLSVKETRHQPAASLKMNSFTSHFKDFS